jgi:hypothetical protein
LTLCTNEGKKVDITGVRLGPSSTGIRISDFAVRPQPAPASDGSINMFGSAAAPLVAAGFTPQARTVTQACGQSLAELGIELWRTGPATGVAESIELGYLSDDQDPDCIVHIPFAVVLCAEGDRAGRCRGTAVP